jgi:hypothetical protein
LTQFSVRCPRCGDYTITHPLAKNFADRPSLRPFLSAHTRQLSERGEQVLLTTENWQALEEGHRHTPVQRKIETVLEYLAKQSTQPGAAVSIGPDDFVLFDAADSQEIGFLLDSLIEQKAITRASSQGLVVTASGWERLMPSSVGGVPGTCFVAMAFDPTLDDAYEAGIKKAIEQCGLRPIRVDRVQTNGIVTDLIMASIRQAQVTIADATLQRNGVYFEAGFALGLGRTVIWTCRHDEMKQVHFDTRQYSHVTWVDPNDLATKLEARIRATVEILIA